MEILILDENLDIIGPVNAFRTLIWIRRYTKIGAFEIHTSSSYFDLLNTGEYLYRNDADELGVIKEVDYKEKENGAVEVYAKGYFAERILKDRVIEKTTMLSGNTEDVMRNLVDLYAINPEDKERTIKNLKLGEINGVGGKLSSQVTGGSLSDELYTLGNAENLSHRIRYNYINNDLIFEVWKGKDRRTTQNVNSFAVFSNSFNNIRKPTYNRKTEDYRNVAYVAGEEREDGTRALVKVDIRSSPDEKIHELYVDARDLQSKDSDGNTLSEAEYNELLEQRGLEKLSEYKIVETASSAVDPSANLVYKKDYDLGDICEYINSDIGIAMDQIITEITETYEKSKMSLDIVLGNDGVSTVQQLIKREA